MASIATLAATGIWSRLVAPSGSDIALNVAAQTVMPVPAVSAGSVLLGNTPPEYLETSLGIKYPTASVYTEKLSNTLLEKFRTFSGTVSVAIDFRHSSDQLQNIQPALEAYVAATCQILDGSRGDWGNGLFYPGGYEIVFGPVKRGGRNYYQQAKLTASLCASI